MPVSLYSALRKIPYRGFATSNGLNCDPYMLLVFVCLWVFSEEAVYVVDWVCMVLLAIRVCFKPHQHKNNISRWAESLGKYINFNLSFFLPQIRKINVLFDNQMYVSTIKIIDSGRFVLHSFTSPLTLMLWQVLPPILIEDYDSDCLFSCRRSMVLFGHSSFLQ